MFFVFAVMVLSLFFAGFGHNKVALFFTALCLVLGIKQFLWEIYSPQIGFQMPWIQTKLTEPLGRQQPGFTVALGRLVYGDCS